MCKSYDKWLQSKITVSFTTKINFSAQHDTHCHLQFINCQASMFLQYYLPVDGAIWKLLIFQNFVKQYIID